MEAEVAGAFRGPPPLYDLKEDMVMMKSIWIFWRMIEVRVKWGAGMIFVTALCGGVGFLVLAGIPYIVEEVVLGIFDLRVPWFDLNFFSLAGFALGVIMGLPFVAEIFVEGYLREIQPLRDEKRKRWAAKTWPKK